MIVIAGKNNIAVNALTHLATFINPENLGIVCNNTENGKDFWQLSLRKKALEIGVSELSLFEAERVADVFISLEFDKIINVKKFNTKEIFNIHFSLLPKYRGVYTSSLPILNNEAETGVTLHQIDSGIDSGCIISQKKIKINDYDCSLDLYIKYCNIGFDLFVDTIKSILNGSYSSTKQDATMLSYYSRESIDFSQNQININQNANDIIKFIKAFAFRPFQLPIYNKRHIVKGEILDCNSKKSNDTTYKSSDDFIDVSALDEFVRLYYDRFDVAYELCKHNNLISNSKILNNLINVDDRTKQLQTLLMISVEKGFFDQTKLLVSYGANVNATDRSGKSVLEYANSRNMIGKNIMIERFLKENGAKI
jgi:methionyl-tRNA formyltransferase